MEVWSDVYDWAIGRGDEEFRDSMARDESKAVAYLTKLIITAIADANDNGRVEENERIALEVAALSSHHKPREVAEFIRSLKEPTK